MTRPADLKQDRWYRIRDNVEIKVCSLPMKYIGTETYRGVMYYNFFDPLMRLGHWIDPENVEPV